MLKPLESCSVHIIGLGLMGGSLALALRDKVCHLSAEDMLPDVLQQALEAGVIDSVGSAARADIVILAVPADRIVELIPTLNICPGTLVIDLGSTKTRICAQLDQLPEGVLAVGGHPMCGLAENGYRHATASIYRGAKFVLCETARTTNEARILAEILVRTVGANPLWMDRERHDHITALTSHLPHLLNFALMRLAMDMSSEDAALYDLAAGGFDGATRLARTDETMIVGMFSTNADQLRAVTARLREHLDYLDVILDDIPTLRAELKDVVSARRSYTSTHGERLIS